MNDCINYKTSYLVMRDQARAPPSSWSMESLNRYAF